MIFNRKTYQELVGLLLNGSTTSLSPPYISPPSPTTITTNTFLYFPHFHELGYFYNGKSKLACDWSTISMTILRMVVTHITLSRPLAARKCRRTACLDVAMVQLLYIWMQSSPLCYVMMLTKINRFSKQLVQKGERKNSIPFWKLEERVRGVKEKGTSAVPKYHLRPLPHLLAFLL